ncbi:MAG: sugar phosphate isomerase/epimerase [Planctomycetota bacterium]|nr:sugar phosphate isomerase/epimerase [Planctomycetota bacterium]
MQKIGITQCAMWGSTLADFLPAAGKAGYEVVEVMSKAEGDLTTSLDAAGIAKVKEQAKAAGVGIDSVAMLHLTQAPIDSGKARDKAVEEIKAGLRLASALGAPRTLLTLGRLRPDLYYEDAYRNGIAALRQAASTAEELGIDVGIEFVWTGFLFSPLETRRFLEEVGSPRIGFYFDPGNMAVFQYPQHWVRALAKHIKGVHFKDWKGNALKGEWTRLLEGGVDFPAVMKELRAAGWDGPLISEVEPNLAPLDKTVQDIRKIMTL